MMNLIIQTSRDGYGTDQIRNTMTVGELVSFLEDYDENQKIYLSFDGGYTYGGITEGSFEEEEKENTEEELDEDEE